MDHEATDGELYLTSLYFIITTITTVGYGDFSGVNNFERIFNMIIMLIGTIGFAYASGILTNMILEDKEANSDMSQQLEILNRLQSEHKFPMHLYVNIKKNLKSDTKTMINDNAAFVQSLPMKLRFKLAEHIYSHFYKTIDVLQGQSKMFLSWICPLLVPKVAYPQQPVFYEGDTVDKFFFVEEGSCAYVLPRFQNQPFLSCGQGTYFGFTDIIASILKANEGTLDSWHDYHLKRTFAVRCVGENICKLLCLDTEIFHRMKVEFSRNYDLFFERGITMLQK